MLSTRKASLGRCHAMPGGTCRGARTCDPATMRPGFPGFCNAPRHVACAGATCSGATPVCTYYANNPEIAPRCEEDPKGAGDGTMDCASPDDCAGYPCWAFPASGYDRQSEWFRCSDFVSPLAMTHGALCKRIEDCPDITYGRSARFGVPDVMFKARACRPDSHLPSGVKRCIYPPDPPAPK